ncbi:hypothetical protein BO70DRAFT_431244 [Aspergillus heteromorphus CBS 117.55]|uniref:Uncharacterized protein n=1 Tax=Aspergillus heteromorphus CBS 117.55 TaxID=1448321 RepID=A0A317VKD8_9EURO|nr:uncharacterized protein BO70DRAFT_431244 [Aspergillus heteromorphus CBS 117.55]PWY74365.1 hypothetical protein BO70DRAFT_431244 [Aspergillus heteromorphus CBS 117.55]
MSSTVEGDELQKVIANMPTRMALPPRHRDLSLSDSEISLLELGPSLTKSALLSRNVMKAHIPAGDQIGRTVVENRTYERTWVGDQTFEQTRQRYTVNWGGEDIHAGTGTETVPIIQTDAPVIGGTDGTGMRVGDTSGAGSETGTETISTAMPGRRYPCR